MKCSKPNCGKPHRARGMCASHYSAWYVEIREIQGNPLPDRTWRASTDWTEEDYEDFWQFVKRERNLV